MTYSIEHRDRIYVKGYGFLSFAKSIGKNLSNKYGRKRFDRAIQKTIQKTVETTGDLIQQKIITLIMKQKYQKKDTYLQKKDNKLLMN